MKLAKLRVYAAQDSRLGAFNQPMFCVHPAQALRAWESAANDPQSPVHQYSHEMALYEIGEYDEEKGELIPLVPIKFVANAAEVKRKPHEDPRQLRIQGT